MTSTSTLEKFTIHRITLNVLFWVFYFLYPFLRFRYTQEHSITIDEVVFYLFFYGLILYGNNLYLLPKYLKNKQYSEYALLLILILLVASLIESYVNKTLLETCDCEGPNSTYVLYNFIHLGTIITVFGAVHVFRTYIKNLKAFEHAENARLEVELKFLRSQVNPHLLFNSLNSIYSYALQHSNEVPDMVLKLSEILRYMLYECDKPLVDLQREINYIKDYIALQKMRMEDADIEFNVVGNFNQKQIAPMVLISFVENAFKFGTQIENPKIRIDLSLENDELRFLCENDYSKRPVIDNVVEKESGGLGIKNSQQLLELAYKDRHQLIIEDLDNRFKVELKLNLE